MLHFILALLILGAVRSEVDDGKFEVSLSKNTDINSWDVSNVISRHKPDGSRLIKPIFFSYLDRMTSILQITNCDNKYQALQKSNKKPSVKNPTTLLYPSELEQYTGISYNDPDLELAYIFNPQQPSLISSDWINLLLNGKGILLLDHNYSKIVISFRSDMELSDYFTMYHDKMSSYWPIVYTTGFWKTIQPKINKNQYSEYYNVYQKAYWNYYWSDLWSYKKVHTGYYNIFNRMFEEIFVQYAAIRLNFPEYQLVIVGHSMGGSIASLTSLSFHHLNISNTLITFNSPKLWTSSVADMYDSISGTEEIKELKTDLENGYLRIWNTRDSWNLFPLNIKTPLSFGGSGMYKHSGLSIATEQSALPYSTEQFIVEYEGVGKWDHEWEKKKCTPVVDNNDLLRGMSWDAHKMLIRDIWACVDMKSDGDQ